MRHHGCYERVRRHCCYERRQDCDCPRRKYSSVRSVVKHECDLSRLNALVKSEPAISEALRTLNPITLFAPTNKSLKHFTPGPTCGELDEILLYHVVPQRLYSKDLVNDKLYDTLRPDSQVRANVYQHPLFRDVITINGVPVVDADLKAKNGVVHKIQPGVLCPPAGNIVQITLNTPELSTLVLAVLRASPAVADALANSPALTLFAPTNDAFAALEEVLQANGCSLLALFDPNNQSVLDLILLYHVLGQTVWSPAIRSRKTRNVPTLAEGKTLDFRRRHDDIMIVDETDATSKIQVADVLATNGAVHLIDRVLLPIPLDELLALLGC